MVENDKLVIGNSESNNSHQKLSKLNKTINLAKLEKLKNHLKLSKSKKTILDNFKILINLTIATNTDATRYLTIKAKIALTYLR